MTDSCAQGCDALQVNLHAFGFELLAPTDVGSVAVRYRRVDCRPVDPIAVHVDAYRVGAGGWLRLALKNVGGDGQVTSIELVRGGAWLAEEEGEEKQDLYRPLGSQTFFAP